MSRTYSFDAGDKVIISTYVKDQYSDSDGEVLRHFHVHNAVLYSVMRFDGSINLFLA